MPITDRTSTGQRTIDCAAGVIITTISAVLLVQWAQSGHHGPVHTGYGVWATLLGGSGLATLAGALLRTTVPGVRQSVGFGCELGGWGGSGFLISMYAIVKFGADRDAALFLALLLIVIMLLGSWRRLLIAMRQAKQNEAKRNGADR